jgi:hypothetical protein
VMRKTRNYIHNYRGYWSERGKYRISIYRQDDHNPVVLCSQLTDNDNTSVSDMAEYLAAKAIKEHHLPIPLLWVKHYPKHYGCPVSTPCPWLVSLVGRTRRFA